MLHLLRTSGSPLIWTIPVAVIATLLYALALIPVVVSRRRLLGSLRAATGSAGGGPRPPSGVLDWVGVLVAVAPLAAAILANTRGRALILTAGAAGEPALRQEQLAQGLSLELHALVVGVLGFAIAALAITIPLALAFGLRGRARALARAAGLLAQNPEAARAWREHPGPSPWLLAGLSMAAVVLVIGPAVLGATRYVLGLITAVGAVGGADPALRQELLDRGVLEARASLRSGFIAAAGGLLLSAIAWAAALLATDPARRRRRISPSAAVPSARRTLLAASLPLLLGGGLLLAVRDQRRENLTPLPPTAANITTTAVTLPKLSGPDRFEYALQATFVTRTGSGRGGAEAPPRQGLRCPSHPADAPEKLLIEEETVSGERLAQCLAGHVGRLKKIEKMTGGQMRFHGRLNLLAAEGLAAVRLEPLLCEAVRAGITTVCLVFAQPLAERPIIKLRATRASAACARLSASETGGGVRSSGFATYGALAAEVVARRTRGQQVAILVGK